MKSKEEGIENCEQCGDRENSDTYTQCKDNYFLFFIIYIAFQVITFIYYGQIDCSGNRNETTFWKKQIYF